MYNSQIRIKMNTIKQKVISIICRAEKCNEATVAYFGSGAFWLALAQGMGALSAFIVTALLARLLPPEYFGEYRFVLSLVPVLAVFTLPGVGTALTKAVAQGGSPKLGTLLSFKIKWGLASAAVSALLSFYYFAQGNETLGYSFLIASLFMPFYEVFFIYSFYLKGRRDFKRSTFYEAFSRIFQALLIVAVATVWDSVEALVFAFFAGKLISEYLAYVKTEQKDDKDQGLEKSILKESIPLSLSALFNIVANNADKILVWHFFGAKVLAVYIVITIFPIQISNILHQIINQLLFIKMSEQKTRKVAYTKQLLIYILALGVLAVPAYGAYIILFPYIFPIYAKYTQYLYLTIPVFITLPTLHMSWYQLFLSGKIKYATSVHALRAILTALGIYVSYIIWGDLSATFVALAVALITTLTISISALSLQSKSLN